MQFSATQFSEYWLEIALSLPLLYSLMLSVVLFIGQHQPRNTYYIFHTCDHMFSCFSQCRFVARTRAWCTAP
jgi:hypothetical protein